MSSALVFEYVSVKVGEFYLFPSGSIKPRHFVVKVVHTKAHSFGDHLGLLNV